jgi:SAM-dependent methyltransferase
MAPTSSSLRGVGMTHRHLEFIREISPDDEMHMGTEEVYFGFGVAALDYIEIALRLARRSEVGRILDFPSGHGRVLRMLRAAYPDAAITACDLDRQAVDFCARIFGAEPRYSHEDPDVLSLGTFDLIWVGSLFTHLAAERWLGFLRLFERSLAPGGVLVFTTAGRVQHGELKDGTRRYAIGDHDALARDYEETGFGYQHYNHSNSYGISLAAPHWVCRQVARVPGLRLLSMTERGWNGRQDAVACQR